MMPSIETLVHDASILWRLLTADIVTTLAVFLIVAAIVLIVTDPAAHTPRHRSRIDPGYVRWLEQRVVLYELTLRFYAKPELYVPQATNELPPIVSERGDVAYRALTRL
jgi:hypothetical protein